MIGDIELEVGSCPLMSAFFYPQALQSINWKSETVLCQRGLRRMKEGRKCPAWMRGREQQHQGFVIF